MIGSPVLRTGSVMVLWDEMAKTLGPCRQWTPKTLAWSGSLLVRITSETKRGPVVGYYRVVETKDGFNVRPIELGKFGWVRDTGEGHWLSTSFGGDVVHCSCMDAKTRCHDPVKGSCCKHRLSLSKLSCIDTE